jgi:hypothetical protein
VRFPKGDPENPLSWEELIEKYRGLTAPVWSPGKVSQVQAASRPLSKKPMYRISQRVCNKAYRVTAAEYQVE